MESGASTAKNSFDLEANSGTEATLSGDGSSATATVTKPGDDWHVKLYAIPGVTLEAGKSYTISLNVTGASGCTVCYKNTAAGAEDGFGTKAIGSGTVTHTVKSTESGTLEILLKIGNVPADTAVTVSGIQISEEADKADEVTPGTVDYWLEPSRERATASASISTPPGLRGPSSCSWTAPPRHLRPVLRPGADGRKGQHLSDHLSRRQ